MELAIMKIFSTISGLLFITYLTYAYIPSENIIQNPKSIEWHTQQHAYFAKIKIAKASSHYKNKRIV
jgi:hypothetical protein